MLENFFEILNNYIIVLLYNWNSFIFFLISTILDLLLWYINREKATKKFITFLVLLFVVIILPISLYIEYIDKNYAYLPDIKYNVNSFQQVEQQLTNIGFKSTNINARCDSISEEQLNQQIEPYGRYFQVTHMEPAPGTLAKKNTTITLNVTLNNNFYNTSIDMEDFFNPTAKPTTPATKPTVKPTAKPTTKPTAKPTAKPTVVPSDFDAKNFYGDINNLFPQNSDEFTLYTAEKALKIITNGIESGSPGVYPISDIPVQVQVINYETNKVIETKSALLGESIKFSKLPNGIYYYIVKATGYKTLFADSPFRLEYNSGVKESIAFHWNNLENIDTTYSSSFKVQLQNEQGIPICHTKAAIYVQNNPTSAYSITTDENGYLAVQHSTDDIIYYDILDFQIANGYYLVVLPDEDIAYYNVTVENGVHIYTYIFN